ncbi:MAG TPA: KOW motif-containing protein, partial [Exilispira sp.]|nr:KOW motif-containing protein [Exilispira sp.]
MKIKVKKDDNVLVIAGREKGKKGKVISVYPEAQR